jgi:hypothetical protein
MVRDWSYKLVTKYFKFKILCFYLILIAEGKAKALHLCIAPPYSKNQFSNRLAIRTYYFDDTVSKSKIACFITLVSSHIKNATYK